MLEKHSKSKLSSCSACSSSSQKGTDKSDSHSECYRIIVLLLLIIHLQSATIQWPSINRWHCAIKGLSQGRNNAGLGVTSTINCWWIFDPPFWTEGNECLLNMHPVAQWVAGCEPSSTNEELLGGGAIMDHRWHHLLLSLNTIEAPRSTDSEQEAVDFGCESVGWTLSVCMVTLLVFSILVCLLIMFMLLWHLTSIRLGKLNQL